MTHSRCIAPTSRESNVSSAVEVVLEMIAYNGAMDSQDQAALAREVQRLNDELEAAVIERDKYRAANETMAQALEQMDSLLRRIKDTEQ